MAKKKKKGAFKCPHGCKKTFKTEGHLKSHNTLKHKETVEKKESINEPKQNVFAELDNAAQELGIDDKEVSEVQNQDNTDDPDPVAREIPKLVSLSPVMAQALVKMPFGAWAKFAKCPELGLTEEEAQELGVLVKQVWDEYSPAWLQKHGALVVLGLHLSMTVGGKMMVLQDFREERKQKQEKNEVRQSGSQERSVNLPKSSHA